MSSKIKLLVFDFGNVLIDLDYERHFKAYREIFGDLWPSNDYHQSVIEQMLRYERGEISDDTFIWKFQQLNPRVNPRLIVDAWHCLLGAIPLPRLDMLKSLKGKYKLALLSNINSLHLRKIHHYLAREYGISDFEYRYFDHVFYSHLMGTRKPEQEIYKEVEDETGYFGQSILFIDDRSENVQSARQRGWSAVQHDPGNEISDCIQSYLADSYQTGEHG